MRVALHEARQATQACFHVLRIVTETCIKLTSYLMLQVRIVKEDGAIGLFRGAGPTVVRAMALNMGMLASNDEASSRTPCFIS